MEIKPAIHPTANAVIKVYGIGGGGNNAIDRMMKSNLEGVEFIVVNTDNQALHFSEAPKKIHIGEQTTRGLGAGAIPDIGKKSAEENRADLKASMEGADMVFLTGGLGGGTGTGALPILAEIAREVGALTVGVVTKPFSFEGQRRMNVADQGFIELKERVDTLITIPNDKLLSIIDRKTSIIDAFEVVDDVLLQAVQGIADLITVRGMINVDFADVKTIMRNAGSALMGIGYGTGENRAVEAAKAAIASPLLDLSIEGAKGILINITGGSDLSMYEVDEAAKVITEFADADANIIFGSVIDESSVGEMKITVIATGFDIKEGASSSALRQKTSMGTKSFSQKPATPAMNYFGRQAPVVSPKPSYGTPMSTPSSNPSSMMKKPLMPLGMEGLEESELDVPAFIRKKMK